MTKKFGFWTTLGGLAALIILVTHYVGVTKETQTGGNVFAEDFRAVSGFRGRKSF